MRYQLSTAMNLEKEEGERKRGKETDRKRGKIERGKRTRRGGSASLGGWR
jgi:hypothetical protein